ncbi:Cullin family protein [Tritrichomonas foetus]|uniref:Cullin family protein n=1 Tax=Tritrichomonas foetus TaxID=1144522 RepID=A0A1J4JE55_9EUKA|nr:Cullin family protein [Tritrichomonas foetus]|eukprot:OHS95947.1 Cullin family protein [Tritrichomonas foetus]
METGGTKRGRPKKYTTVSHVTMPIPQVEDYPNLPEDDLEIMNFRQADRILVGFKEIDHTNKPVLPCPFQLPQSLLDTHRIQQYEENVIALFNQKSNTNNFEYPSKQIFTFAISLSHYDESSTVYDFIISKIRQVVSVIPEDMKEFTNALEIGQYWQMVSSKLNLVTTSWAPLCVKKKSLPDFKTVFINLLNEVFIVNEELFEKLSEIIVNAYSEARYNNNIQPILYAFKFACKNVLFEKIFLPMLFKSIRGYLTPLLDEFFTKPLSKYLQSAVDLKETEKNLIKPLIPLSALHKLEAEMNTLIFGDKNRFNQITNKGLASLIVEKDTKSVGICADFARSTDTINQFTRELSFEFEAEAEKCFKTPNPIEAILKLYLSLAEFDDKFNQSHARTLRSNFEKGFNASSDTAARLLAEEVHREFIRKEKCPKETIDQLVAVFRMLASKDVFEVAHHLLLSRRILMMKSHIVASDEYFLAALREQCGPEYTKRFDAVFDDLKRSIESFEPFVRDKRPPSYFKALVMSKDSWTYEASQIVPPDNIRTLLDSYSDYFRQMHGKRKLEWDFKYTRVKLSVQNLPNIKTIHCSGIVATFLLMFNRFRVLSPDDFKRRAKFTSEQIDEVVNLLKSKRCGNLILMMHKKIRINKDAFGADKNGLLSIPFIFPALPKYDNDKHKSAILSNREQQVDAAVMRVMKNERSMEKSDLKETVKDLLNFRLEDELYEKRLASLSKTLYLKLDPSGRVHYLP